VAQGVNDFNLVVQLLAADGTPLTQVQTLNTHLAQNQQLL
jgi:hypothetical protein